MAENESQFWPILYVVGNLLLYYQEGDLSKVVSPDLMVVFGASKHVRSSYRLWEEPKAPDFVLEITAESTYRTDRGEKRDTYAGMGVMEYWQYDPVGTHLDPPLLGFRLVEGHYAPVPASAQDVGLLTLRSEVLGLELRLTLGAPVREALHFYDSVRGEYLRTYREADQAREEAERGRDEEEARARREAEDRLREEQATRQALEAELRELRQRGG